MEEIAVQKTTCAEAKERAEMLQIDLFSLREMIINVTQNMEKVNPDKKKSNRIEKWKAGEDVENLGEMLTKYFTNAS